MNSTSHNVLVDQIYWNLVQSKKSAEQNENTLTKS